MEHIYNFSAGPAILPAEVLQQARDEMLDWHGSGMSVMEMSHRGKEFIGIAAKAEADLRTLLSIPANYKVLFLQGGAIAENALVPMNLLAGRTAADYINTGEWSKKSIKEAKKYCTVNVAASAEDRNFTYIPPRETWKLDAAAAYVHVCTNETIGGVEYQWTPDTGAVPLVADMSSHILSRAIDVAKYGVIYGGAQKNAGPAGVTIVVLREDLVERIPRGVPTMLDYRTHVEHRSLYNTPPVFAIYVLMLVTRWLRDEVGGLEAMAERNREKASLLYDEIDGSDGFYRGHAAASSRSRMNVTFRLPDEAMEKEFVARAAAEGMVELAGHRSVGGVRASIYNAVPVEAVRALRSFMERFRTATP